MDVTLSCAMVRELHVCARFFVGRMWTHFFSPVTRTKKMHGTSASIDTVWGVNDDGGVSARAVVSASEAPPVPAVPEDLHDVVDALRAELAHRTGVFLVLLVACVFVLTQRIQQLEHRARLRAEVPPHPWW